MSQRRTRRCVHWYLTFRQFSKTMEVPMHSGDLPRKAADIPTEVYAQPEILSGAKPGGSVGPAPPHKICAVCQRAIEYHSAVKVLVCTHACHADCADGWLRSELHCPLCKNQVLFPMAMPTPVYSAAPAGYPTGQPMARAVPSNGTNAQLYGICRDCQQTFYRDPHKVKPETNAWYRCPDCRSSDAINMLRASCSVQ